jgi:hypothetical protein
MGNWRLVLDSSLMSDIHLSCDERSFALCITYYVNYWSDLLSSGDSYQSNHLDLPLLKLIPHLRKGAELRRAYWSEVCWVAEEDGPAVAEPLVEVDVALGCFCLEVGGFGAES